MIPNGGTLVPSDVDAEADAAAPGDGPPLMEGWACGDRTVNITESNVGMGTSLLAMIQNEGNKVYTGVVAYTGAQYWQFLFGTTVTLHGLLYTQDLTNNQGTFDIETLSGGIYTAQASTVVLGAGGAQLGDRYVNEFAIDADKRALCDGIRLRGMSGGSSNGPWRHNLRFFVSIPVP